MRVQTYGYIIRNVSLNGVDTIPGLDRDEYPPAMSLEGGNGASVRHINPSDNRGAGSKASHQLKTYPDGTYTDLKLQSKWR